MFISLKTVQRISIKIDNKSLKGSFKCVSAHSLLVAAHLLPQKCLKLSLSWLEIYCEIPDGLFIPAYALNVHQNQRYRRAVLYFYSIYTPWSQ